MAFLIHPRTDVARDLGGVCRPLGWVPTAAYKALMRRDKLPSVVTGTLRHADAPGVRAGWLITVPLTPSELLTGSRRWTGGDAARVKRPAAAGDCLVNALWAMKHGMWAGHNMARSLQARPLKRFSYRG